jgi:hypothetical protein
LSEEFLKMNDLIKLKYNLRTNSPPLVLEYYLQSVPVIAFITKTGKISLYKGPRSFHHVQSWIQEIATIILKETIDPMKINN